MPAWFVQREELLREITLKHGERRFPCVRSCVQESQKVPHCLLQLIEDLPSKQPVVGSNPTGGVCKSQAWPGFFIALRIPGSGSDAP